MKGSETKLVSYMQGSDKRFIIPVYQRNYDWRIENCKQLFDDLIIVIRKQRNSHFFGSIVSVHNDGSYEQNPEDLVFYLRDEGEKKAEEEAGTRAAQRRRYWEFTLPQIKEAHGSDGSFKNVNPSSDYWINGWFGISGFKLSCCINSKRVSAGVDLAKGEREKNKAAFDYLFVRKDEIEKQIGASLEWTRFEGKASYISYALDFGIDDETSWPKLAKFQAEWSKKFYDVFVPLLREWDEKENN